MGGARTNPGCQCTYLFTHTQPVYFNKERKTALQPACFKANRGVKKDITKTLLSHDFPPSAESKG